ncbi:MAG: thioesterase family protein, partial [Burkholderiaceae bacterium]
ADADAGTSIAAPARRSPDEQQRLEQMLRDLFESGLPFNRVLGIEVLSADPAAPSFGFAMRPQLVGHPLYGRLHGGVISAVLDATGGFAVLCALAEKHSNETAEQLAHRFGRLGTIDLRVDYLHQGMGERFVSRAEVTRLGGRIGSVQMRLENDSGMLIATGAAAYIIS